MAIIPWSWTKSNGTATDAQTIAAYNAITSKGNTDNFSRMVWNDLVSKINETATALGRGWSNKILSLSATKMNAMYSPLSAKMFNSARLNTNYYVWSWSTDDTKSGYIGRNDFRGVEDMGERDADFVYGRYFLELTDRLNLVINIVNGDGDTVELKETIGALVELASELSAFASKLFKAKYSFSFSHTALMEAKKQSTWVLHFNVDAPTAKAVFEIGNYKFCETNLYISPNIVRKPKTSPSSPLMVRFYFPQEYKTDFTLDASRPLVVDYTDTPSFKTDITQERPQPLKAIYQEIIDSDGNVVQIEPRQLYATSSDSLAHSAVLAQERMGIFAVYGVIYHYTRATTKTNRSAKFSGNISMNHIIKKHTAHTAHSGPVGNQTDMVLNIGSKAHTGFTEDAGCDIPVKLQIQRTVHSFPSIPAHHRHPAYLNSIPDMNLALSIPANVNSNIEYAMLSTLVAEHIEFFIVGMKTALTVKSHLSYLGSFPLTIAQLEKLASKAAFSMEVIKPLTLRFRQMSTIKAHLQSEDLPTLTIHAVNDVTWRTDFSFLEGRPLSFKDPLVLGYKPIFERTNPSGMNNVTDITIDPVADAEAKILRFATAVTQNRLTIKSSIKNGKPKPQKETISFTADSSATLGHAAGIIKFHIDQFDIIQTDSIMNTDVSYPQNASFHGTMGYSAGLDSIRYVYPSVKQTEVLNGNAHMVTTGNWINPLKVGADLMVIQVYEPESFDVHAFLDFGVYKAAVDNSLTTPHAEPDMQYHKDTTAVYGLSVTASGDINFVNVTAWEHPVKTENILSITQVAFTKIYEQKLEVG